jgi:hypothetical protein
MLLKAKLAAKRSVLNAATLGARFPIQKGILLVHYIGMMI